MIHPHVPFAVSVMFTPVLLLPVFVGTLAAWGAGHVMAHLTVKALAKSMDMTSRSGHRRYYRVDPDFRADHHW